MKTTMKIIAALPALALISACSTTAPMMPTTPATPVADSMSDMAYDRMAPAPYTCTDNVKVLAKQSINKNQATINVTAPKFNWSQQPIILVGGVEGETASYVNQSNPEVIYAWHMQGDQGVLAMKWASGQTYQADCKIGR